ncbi:MAG: hypothetical protein AAF942_04295 [Pseudomonadota bacterium]
MSFENLDLSGLDGTAGFRIDGAAGGDGLGAAVSSAGDINNDGFADLIIRAENAPTAFVVFGSGGGFDPTFSISDLDGTNGFRIEGVDGPFPESIRAAGDVNGDGIDDVIVGSAGSSVTGDEPEEAFVVFGRNGGFTAALDVSDLDGTNGFALQRFPTEFEGSSANFGGAVSGIGDINADGIDDIVAGAEFVTFEDTAAVNGEADVFFGSRDGFPATFDVAGLDGSNGFTLFGDVLDFSGSSLDGGGDVNGDGIADLIVNSPFPNCGVGAINVVFGSDQGFPERLSLAGLDGTDGFTILGSEPCDVIGDSIRIVEDINGDGFDEILIGGPNVNFYSADGNTESFSAGEAYVVFGSDSGFDPLISVDDLDGSNGFRLQSTLEGNELGISVSRAGDINGDGLGDTIVGSAVPAGPGGALTGEAHVLFGSLDGFDPVIDIASIDGNLGFRLEGTPTDTPSSFRVSDAGDFNGDGLDDFLLGAPASSLSGLDGSGASFVLFGAAPAAATLQVGLFDADTDQLVQVLEDGAQIQAGLLEGRNLTLVATVQDDGPLADQVEAVELDLNDGQFTKTEKFEPYALFGNSGGDFFGGGKIPTGDNSLSLEVFDNDGLVGNPLETVNIDFTIVDEPPDQSAVEVGLFDAASDTLIDQIEDVDAFSLSAADRADLTIGVSVPVDSPLAGKVQSVSLNLNDGQATRIENADPYTLFGDFDGDLFDGDGLPAGANTLSLQVFSKKQGQGDLLDTIDIDFTITETGAFIA